ncbi:SPARC [Amia ocellicauda]|uniref:SPARC n=1 Tax=Amia ocellicauda TaxID=2972642 RepID=UPI003464C70D
MAPVCPQTGEGQAEALQQHSTDHRQLRGQMVTGSQGARVPGCRAPPGSDAGSTPRPSCLQQLEEEEKRKKKKKKAEAVWELQPMGPTMPLVLTLLLLALHLDPGTRASSADSQCSSGYRGGRETSDRSRSFTGEGCTALQAGRAQRRQRLAEETLQPYVGRVDSEELCRMLRCHSPTGSWCQVVRESGVLVPKCVCPQRCPRQGAPVCSVLGKSYGSPCLLHKEACRKRRRIGLAHPGRCKVPQTLCSEEEYGQFPYRLLDWFLLISRLRESDSSAASQSCLSHTQRRDLAEGQFGRLDRNRDGKLSRRDLRKLHYKQMPLEQCALRFFQSCDSDRNRKVTLQEWTGCLVDRSEDWYQDFMSMKMGSSKVCPAGDSNH